MSRPERTIEDDLLRLETGLRAFEDDPAFRGSVESLDGHRSADHLASIYETREEQFAAAIPFVKRGLERGERCVYIADENDGEEVLAAMRAAGVGDLVDAALASGALTIHTAQETYLRNGAFDPDDMIAFLSETVDASGEFEGLRIAGEMTWVLGDEPRLETIMEYEAKLNAFFPDVDAIALCQYSRERFPPEVIRDVVRTHPHLVYDGTVCHNFYYTPPEEFFGPDQPSHEVDRMMGTLLDRTRARTALREHRRYLQRLNEITASTNQSFEEKLQAVLDLGCERFGLELGAMARVDPGSDRFEIEYASADHEHLAPGAELPLSETYCTAAAERVGVAGVSDPVAEGYEGTIVHREFGIRAYLGAYVELDGASDRTFFFVSSQPREREFSADERAFQRLMSQWVRYELDRRQRERDLRELYDITADTDGTFDEKLRRLFEFGCERFDLELGGIARIDPDTDLFEVELVSGEHEHLQPGARAALSETYCRLVSGDEATAGVTDPVGRGFEDTAAHRVFGVKAYLGTHLPLDDGLDRTFFFVSTEPRDREFSEAERTLHHLMGQWVRYELDRRQRERFQHELNRITSTRALPFEEKVERILDLGRERFGLDVGMLNRKEDDEFRVMHVRGMPEVEAGTTTVEPDPQQFCNETMAVDVPVGVEDVETAGWGDDPLATEVGLGCYLGVKVVAGDEAYGTLCFAEGEARRDSFTATERSFLRLMGQCVSYELDRERRESQLAGLNEMSRHLMDAESPDAIADHAVERAREELRTPLLALALHDEATGELSVAARTPRMAEEVPVAALCEDDAGPVRGAFDADEVRSVTDLPSVTGGPSDLTELLAIPMGCRGVYVTGTTAPGGFSPAAREFAETMAATIEATCTRAHRERQLHERERALEKSNERLEEFAYAASHDLQEPLRMVSSYLQLLEGRYADELDADAEEFIGFAVDGAERMRDMISGLLQYSRIDTKGKPLEPVELDAVVEDALTDLQVQVEESGAEITTEPLPRVAGDASQLGQVFRNLLSNAIKYSGDETPRVHVSADREGSSCTIAVRDEGIGIDPDDAERIFHVFDRLHTRSEYAGTGIGLSICRRVVERHGGEIRVDSEPGEGATFSVTLRAADDRE